MPTDFFERQDAARGRTWWLLVLYFLGVLGLVAVAYAAVVIVFSFQKTKPGVAKPPVWQPELFALVAAGVGATVGAGSAYKVAELAGGGGRTVAELLGGQEVPGNTRDPAHRRLLNVVEEMSIASGTRMPSVFVLSDEAGINAFAAGHNTGDAVVAVSRGTLEYLTRDELQGVIAHEFSHILNGDMKMNLRLIGLLHGILMISVVGEILFRLTNNRSSSRDDNKSAAAFAILGLILMVLGWVGVMFGRLIQAAVSRQREYLADASAVQFTRNPAGIAGALKKIGGLQAGSTLTTSRASEAAHMFFAEGTRMWILDPLATHPPLEKRVKLLDPSFDGTWPNVKPVVVPWEQPATAADKPKPNALPKIPGLPSLPGLPNVPIPVLALADGQAEQRAGTVSQADIDLAALLHADFPDELREAAGDPFTARALVLALLFDTRPDVRAKQTAALQAGGDPLLTAETLKLTATVDPLSEAARLPLVDLAVSALRQMSVGQYDSFRPVLKALIEADNQVSLYEYALSCVVTAALDRRFKRVPPLASTTLTAVGLRPRLVPVLSFVAWESLSGVEQEAFAAGVEAYRPGLPPLTLTPRSQIDLKEFDAAVRAFAAAGSAVRRSVVTACVACVRRDNKTSLREAELLRAVAAVLDCPLPVGYAAADNAPDADRL